MPKVRTCPKCHSTNVHRSHRRGFVEHRILPLLLKRPYRCHNCNWRYHDFTFHKTGERQADPHLHGDREQEPAQ